MTLGAWIQNSEVALWLVLGGASCPKHFTKELVVVVTILVDE